jgi:hypothetical protein
MGLTSRLLSPDKRAKRSSWAKRLRKGQATAIEPDDEKLILRTDDVKQHYFRVWQRCAMSALWTRSGCAFNRSVQHRL